MTIEEKISEVKLTLVEFSKSKEKDLDCETGDISYASPVSMGKNKINTNPFSNGTASGGLLTVSDPHKSCASQTFDEQNFEYFYDNPKISAKYEEEIYPIIYESYENLRCCRSKFFCF